MSEIFAVAARTNAELIRDCATLGYLNVDDVVLDPTYGLGRFWMLWRPRHLVASDLDPERSPVGRPVDFRALPWSTSPFDAVTFDPPYKLNGTGGGGPGDHAYGVATGMRWQDRHQLIHDGITECVRVLRTGGTLLVKCQDQVCSGQKRWQTREFAATAEALGCRLVDMLHVLGGRAQPAGRRQVHSRTNYSTMLVLRKVA